MRCPDCGSANKQVNRPDICANCGLHFEAGKLRRVSCPRCGDVRETDDPHPRCICQAHEPPEVVGVEMIEVDDPSSAKGRPSGFDSEDPGSSPGDGAKRPLNCPFFNHPVSLVEGEGWAEVADVECRVTMKEAGFGAAKRVVKRWNTRNPSCET